MVSVKPFSSQTMLDKSPQHVRMRTWPFQVWKWCLVRPLLPVLIQFLVCHSPWACLANRLFHLHAFDRPYLEHIKIVLNPDGK